MITTELKANLKFYIDKAVNGDSVLVIRFKKKMLFSPAV